MLRYRRFLQARYLDVTCGDCGEEALDEVCACGSMARLTARQLEDLRTDDLDRYTDHQDRLNRYVRQGMAEAGIDYSPFLPPGSAAGVPEPPEGRR